jgi:hypothetical protein
MKLKVFVPDMPVQLSRKTCTPFLYSFIATDLNNHERREKYGDWINLIEMVGSVNDCHVVIPAYHLNYYYAEKKTTELFKINNNAADALKLTVCFTIGDWGITPSLKNFHLYRLGGYASENEGNRFCMPFFLGNDPVEKYFGGVFNIHQTKTDKPIIGFCGRASDNLLSALIDIAKNIRRAILKIAGRRNEDMDWTFGTSRKRFKMLRRIKRSGLVQTNFILNKSFGGGKTKQALLNQFYANMNESQYIFCYRGWGNFSIRLYETLACGRIPVIIKTDNNLPFAKEIDWNMFPVIEAADAKNIAQQLLSFHSKLSNEQFVGLQYKSRELWEKYMTYKGFMTNIITGYLSANKI